MLLSWKDMLPFSKCVWKAFPTHDCHETTLLELSLGAKIGLFLGKDQILWQKSWYLPSNWWLTMMHCLVFWRDHFNVIILTCSWFFLRWMSSSFRASISLSRFIRLMLVSSMTFLRPTMSASTDWRMASSDSYLKRSGGMVRMNLCQLLTFMENGSTLYNYSSEFVLTD